MAETSETKGETKSKPKKAKSASKGSKKAGKAAKKAKTRRKGTSSVDVAQLRKDIGAHFGRNFGREHLAKLLGCSSASIIQWESKGLTPSAKFLPKIEALTKKVESGNFSGIDAPPKPGRKPSNESKPKKASTGPAKKATAPPAKKPASDGTTLTASELARALLDHAVSASNPGPLIEAARSLLSE